MPSKNRTKRLPEFVQTSPMAETLASSGNPHATRTLKRNRILFMCLALVVLTSGVWIRVIKNSFINYDDVGYVTENPNIQTGLNWKTVSWALTSTYERNWHPLTWLSHALDYQLFGLNPAGHHFTNLLLHLVNVVLLFLLLNSATRQAGRAFCVAALFAVHPLNVESVAWVAERKNVLCTLFFLLALAAYGWYVRKPNPARYFLVAVVFALGLASKPMVITLPCLLLLLDVWPLQRIQRPSWLSRTPQKQQRQIDLQERWRVNTTAPSLSLSRAIVEKFPLLALSAASAVVTVYAQRAGITSAAELPLGLRFGNAIRSYALYVWKAFLPIGLAPIYPHPRDTLSLWQVALAAVFLVLVSLWVWMKRSSAPYLLVGWLWFLGALVPVIGVVQVGEQALADRYAYIPLIGIMVMVVWSVADFTDRVSTGHRWQVAIPLIALATFSFLTWRQLGFWHTQVELWTHTLAVTSNNTVAESNMGSALVEAGRFDEAILHFKSVIRMDPQDATSYANLAAESQKQGKLQDAIGLYELALTASEAPKLRSQVHVNLWTIYTQLGDFARAQENFSQALAYDSQIARSLIPSFLQSVNTHPTAQSYLQLGQLLRSSGDLDDARSAYQRALGLDPNYAQAKTLLAQLNRPGK